MIIFQFFFTPMTRSVYSSSATRAERNTRSIQRSTPRSHRTPTRTKPRTERGTTMSYCTFTAIHSPPHNPTRTRQRIIITGTRSHEPNGSAQHHPNFSKNHSGATRTQPNSSLAFLAFATWQRIRINLYVITRVFSP